MTTTVDRRADDRLLGDVLDELAAAGASRRGSLGAVSGAGDTHPPQHCLRLCLGGDRNAISSRGCSFLQGAAQQRVDVARLSEGCCPKGLRVSTFQSSIAGRPIILIGLEEPGEPGAAQGDQAGDAMLTRLGGASRLLERVARLAEENAGFADELLHSYEQLNLVFDLTQQLARVTDAAQIGGVLSDNVRRVLHTSAVRLVQGDDARSAAEACAGAAGAALTEVVACRAVSVVSDAIRHAIAGPFARLDGEPDVLLVERDASEAPFTSGDMRLLESVLSFGGQLRCNAELHERLRRTATDVTRALVAAIDKKDHYTCGHSERVGFLTRLIAEELGLPAEEVQTMEWSGVLHDIGKIGVPEAVLCKRGRLTDEEFELIKQHPRMGEEILRPIGILKTIVDGVLYHHEYMDGSGYPERLKGEEIPLVARIIHVADAFDALTSDRSYRSGFSIARAIEILEQERGARSDAAVVDAFIRAWRTFRATRPSEVAARFPYTREVDDDRS